MAAKRRPTADKFPVSPTTAPMEALLVDELPKEDGWQFEPKWDGFRCLAFRGGDEVELKAKSGKPLSRFFPEMVAALRALPVSEFVIDGELAIPQGSELSFDALQMRLHPAESRIRKLSIETPAIFILFDCLMTPRDGTLRDAPLTERRAALERFFAAVRKSPALRLTPYTRDPKEARRWLSRAPGARARLGANRPDGV
jgi:ATP-dependent DNA ligase